MGDGVMRLGLHYPFRITPFAFLALQALNLLQQAVTLLQQKFMLVEQFLALALKCELMVGKTTIV